MGLRKSLRRIVRDMRPAKNHHTDFSFDSIGWLLSREPTGVPDLAVTCVEEVDDTQLVQRVMKAYQAASDEFIPSQSFWDKSILKLNEDIHTALRGNDVSLAADKLSNPASNYHFWGFDSIATAPKGKVEPHQSLLENLDHSRDWQQSYALWIQDMLLSFADAVGARNLNYPESPRKHTPVDVDEILTKIERAVGTKILFPNPYSGEKGLKTLRGIASFRAIQSLYQGWRIAGLGKGKKNFRVLEIGAGLGRTAYFAHMFGVSDYSILDVPMTRAAQGYFLGRVLGNDKVQLHKENKGGIVRIIPASELKHLDEKFDLIVNVDSFTEMSTQTMREYWEFARHSTPMMLSINHEENSESVRTLFTGDSAIYVHRYPYWMRRGYVEEIVHFPA